MQQTEDEMITHWATLLREGFSAQAILITIEDYVTQTA